MRKKIIKNAIIKSKDFEIEKIQKKFINLIYRNCKKMKQVFLSKKGIEVLDVPNPKIEKELTS